MNGEAAVMRSFGKLSDGDRNGRLRRIVEARSDYDIFADFSARLGNGDEFTQDYYSPTS